MSDKALCCPACGYENQAQEKKIQNFCIECGNKLSENDTVCSVCGCPINKEHENLEQLQKVEVASIKIPKISKQKKTTLIVSIVLLVILKNPKGSLHNGGQIAAPTAGKMFAEILPYMGIESGNKVNETNNNLSESDLY